MCRKDDTTAAEIARIAQTDPALAGRLIRQANSAAHGGGRLASVTEAILRLGLKTVRNLALGFSLVDQYQNGPCEGFDYQTFWSHSLLMGLAMQKVCAMTRRHGRRALRLRPAGSHQLPRAGHRLPVRNTQTCCGGKRRTFSSRRSNRNICTPTTTN